MTAPLRLTLAGGGTDLPEYFMGRGARVLTAAVRLGVRVSVAGAPAPHGALVDLFRSRNEAIPIAVDSDVSAGAGLGGSGALAVCLVKLEALCRDRRMSPLEIGREAYRWERELLGESTGFQDHMAAAFGGVTEAVATVDGVVTARRRTELAAAWRHMLSSCVVLADLAQRRAAGPLLDSLASAWRGGRAVDTPSVEDAERAIRGADPVALGSIFRRQWERKLKLVAEAGSELAIVAVDVAQRSGAAGAKVMGAGGGGFLIAACSPRTRDGVAAGLTGAGLRIVEPTFMPVGVRGLRASTA